MTLQQLSRKNIFFVIVLFVFANTTISQNNTTTLTIKQVRDLFKGTAVRITQPYKVFGIVSADEKSGNIYKNIYMQDAEAGINIRLQSQGAFTVGDSIGINLNGIKLANYSGLLCLDSVDINTKILKLAAKKNITPQTISLNELKASHESKLVTISNVQFHEQETGKTFADAVNHKPANLLITDCNNKTIILRNGGYAKFAAEKLPLGNGSITAVVGKYNDNLQLYIRNTNDINFNNERCKKQDTIVELINESFTNLAAGVDIDLKGWKNIATNGNRKWRTTNFNKNNFAQINSHNSFDSINCAWLVSPAIKYNVNKMLSFKTSKSFFNHTSKALTVYLSTDFNGYNPNKSSWTEIKDAIIAGEKDSDNKWISSGSIDLKNYVPNNYDGTFYVAFKYIGSKTQTSTYKIDDIIISNK